MQGIKQIETMFDEHGSNLPLLAQTCVERFPEFIGDPAHVSVVISLNKLDYQSEAFQKSTFKTSSRIKVAHKCKGKIEIHIHPEIKDLDATLSGAQEIADLTAGLFEKTIRAMPTTDITLNSEKRYQLLAENSVDVIWIMDPLLNFTYISPSVEQMTGFTAEEWVGSNLSEHATRKEFLKMAGQALRAMRDYKKFKYAIFTANMLHKDGSQIPVEIIGRLLLNDRGLPIGVQGSTRDISERIKAQKTIKESQDRYLESIEKLYQAGARLGQSLDLQKIYTTLYSIISEVMACDGMVISSYNARNKQFICEAMFVDGKNLDVSEFPSVDLVVKGKGVQSQVIHSKESLILNDYQKHLDQSQKFYYVDESGLRREKEIPEDEEITYSAILVPLLRERRIIGVIQITSYKKDSYSSEDLRFLEAFAPQIASAISNAALFEETQQARSDLLLTLQGTVQMLARTVETRDPYTAGHQRRVAKLATAIAEKMGLDEDQVNGIYMASTVHDIGKINIPVEILSKPGKLSPLEFDLIKSHPLTAANLLEGITFPWPMAEIILQHHEKLDGSGYPQGLSGDGISSGARILTVADIVEAMSSHRPYREALGIDAALEQIKHDSGTKLDPLVVDACLSVFRDGFQFSNDRLQ